MGLVGVREHSGINLELLDYAAKNIPCLIIDCSNIANPHLLYPKYTINELSNIYVIPVELIYTFRDVLQNLNKTCIEKGINKVIITKFGRLINYQNDEENNNIYNQSWELLKKHSLLLDIRIAIPKDQKETARRYCDIIL
jgi:hypothetical protein